MDSGQQELDLDGLGARLVRVTPARLATWDDCPRRYRMAYLDRPTPSKAGPWAHNTLGAVVHNVLRELFGLPASQRTPAKAAELVRRAWRGDGFADQQQSARFRARAQEWVAAYIADVDPELELVGLERWLSASVDGILAEGRADRIDLRDGELVIVDYKTGRREPNSEDAARSRALAIYAVAASRTLRRTTTRVELHHLPTGTVASFNHTQDSIAAHIRSAQSSAMELNEAAEGLERGGDPKDLFPAQTGQQCSWCDFRAHCPEGQAAAPEALPWQALSE